MDRFGMHVVSMGHKELAELGLAPPQLVLADVEGDWWLPVAVPDGTGPRYWPGYGWEPDPRHWIPVSLNIHKCLTSFLAGSGLVRIVNDVHCFYVEACDPWALFYLAHERCKKGWTDTWGLYDEASYFSDTGFQGLLAVQMLELAADRPRLEAEWALLQLSI